MNTTYLLLHVAATYIIIVDAYILALNVLYLNS